MEKKKTQKNTIITKIAVSTFIAIFSLASAFAGTYAWFSSNQAVTVSGGTFTVQTPTGISYELYYLEGFDTNDDGAIDKDGNYNSVAQEFTGYETVAGDAVFDSVIEEADPNPTDVTHLWPAHKLTYALVINDSFSLFSLDSWLQTTSNDAKVSSEVFVSISWATDIFGAAYYIEETNDIISDIGTGFESFADDIENGDVVDVFTYSEAGTNDPNPPTSITNSVTDASGGAASTRTILYFSIVFSNEEDTFYTKNGLYYTQSVFGNSNCYKGLSLHDLVFKLA